MGEAMKTVRYEIFFEDEVPRIATGKRRVEAEVGWKWVYLHVPFQQTRVRIKRTLFDALKPKRVEA
jgi:hypothetical protein